MEYDDIKKKTEKRILDHRTLEHRRIEYTTWSNRSYNHYTIRTRNIRT